MCRSNSLFFSLFLSTANYCHHVWKLTSLHNKEKLKVAQKWSIRTITNMPWHSHTNDYFAKLSIIKITSLYLYRLACLYIAAVKTNDTFLPNFFNLRVHHWSCNAWHKETYTIYRPLKMICVQPIVTLKATCSIKSAVNA